MKFISSFLFHFLFAGACSTAAFADQIAEANQSPCLKKSLDQCFDIANSSAEGKPVFARELSRLACAQDDVWSCGLQGSLVALGIGGDKNLNQGLSLLATACENSVPFSCRNFSKFAKENYLLPSQYEAAEQYADLGCTLFDAESCRILGEIKYEKSQNRAHFIEVANLLFLSCDLGDPKACYYIGSFFRYAGYVNNPLSKAGRHFKANVGLAKVYHQIGCDGKIALACTEVGHMMQDSARDDDELAIAWTFYERGCELGDETGCDYWHQGQPIVVRIVGKHSKLEEDPLSTLEQWLALCAAEDALACKDVGIAYDNGDGTAHDYEKAVSFYDKGCALGSEESCAFFGDMLRHGKGHPMDVKRAFHLFERSCANGSMWGCRELANMFELGEVAQQDRIRAFSMYERLCDQGELQSCSAIAGDAMNRFEKNGFDAGDARTIRNGFGAACAGGYAQACNTLGTYYERVIRPRLSGEKIAFRYYSMACQLNYAVACRNVAVYYEFGAGELPVEQMLADEFHEKACTLGHEVSCL
jgi:TPR repeat protein